LKVLDKYNDLLNPAEVLKRIGLKKGDKLIDAGCGNGRFTIPASNIVGKDGKIYAIDISVEAINSLKRRIHEMRIRNIEVFIRDISDRLPIEDKSIDIYLMANILHGIVASGKVDNTLREVYRVLKPHGILGIIDFKKISGPPGPPLSIRLSPDEMRSFICKPE